MEITELDKKKMEVVKELADMNVLLAKTQDELSELEKGKEDFIWKRENEVLGRIHKLLNNSRILLEETNANYTLVHSFYETLKGFSEHISKAHDNFLEMVESFNEKNELWEKGLNEREEDLSRLSQEVNGDQVSINKQKDFIKGKEKELEKETKHIESKHQQIQSALEYLKNKQK